MNKFLSKNFVILYIIISCLIAYLYASYRSQNAPDYPESQYKD